jgi:hypothetical protein
MKMVRSILGTKKEHPILFSAPMVKAILEGRKTMTRRVVKGIDGSDPLYETRGGQLVDTLSLCPYGQVGDRLWVKETYGSHYGYVYKATDEGKCLPSGGWKSGMFMPKAASRITLEITGVKVERVQEMSQEDAMHEGVTGSPHPTMHHVGLFMLLWDSLNAKRGYPWKGNPWVWVISFRKVTV